MTTTITLDIAEDPKSRRLGDAYKNAARKTPECIDFMYKYWNEEPAVEVDGRGNTLIDLIAMCGNEEALKKLIPEVTIEQLHRQNAGGHTVLHHAVRKGNVSIINILLDREKELSETTCCALKERHGLISVGNEMGETPLYLAAALGKKDAFECLESHGSDWNTQRKSDGFNILHAAIMGEHFYLAIIIFEKYPKLAHKPDKQGETALNLLATLSAHYFKSGSMYSFANLGKTPSIPNQILGILIYICIKPMYTKKADKIERVSRGVIMEAILKCDWIKPIDDAKQKHILALELARKMVKLETDWRRYAYTEHKDYQNRKQIAKKNNDASDPLIQAIEKETPELVKLIIHECPDSANSIDENGRNVLHKAAQTKNISIYEFLMKNVPNKEMMFAETDFDGNTILHQTSNIVRPITTGFTLGVANLMAWDVYWFQRVHRDCAPHLRRFRNEKGQMARDIFMETISEQRKEAEKVLKDMNGGLMVVATLIGTVSFAAIFTLPGGFEQNDGYPLLFKHDRSGETLFLGYDTSTLFASAVALGSLLSIQLSRFHVDDFYIALPFKYALAITALFYSTTYVITTCLQAFILEESLFRCYLPVVILVGFLECLGFIDSIYYVISYLVEVLRYSLTYTAGDKDQLSN